MEVDEEVEADLLRQFNCLNTCDKDVLIKELQVLLGRNTNISEQAARFYLDMADWNLQAAICAYFDLQSSTRLPRMTFVQDVTIGEGESVTPDTSFVKTWRVENSGSECWPEGCRLMHTGGERLGASETSEPLVCLPTRNRLDISMQMVAPQRLGLYSSKWRMTTQQGHFFGDTIWVIIQVDDGGTLALMQQMVNLKELGSPPPTAPPPSPAHTASLPIPPTTTATTNPFSLHKDTHALSSSCPANATTHVFGCSPPSALAATAVVAPLSSPRQGESGRESCYFAMSPTTNTITSSTGTFPSTYCTASQNPSLLRHSFNNPFVNAASASHSMSSSCYNRSNNISEHLVVPFPALTCSSVLPPVPPANSSSIVSSALQSAAGWAPDSDHDVTMS